MADGFKLVEGIRAGSRTDFSSLVERYAREVYPFLSRISGSGAAERLTQQTFVKAWDGASTFHTDRPLRAWLLGLAVRIAGDHEGFDGRWDAAVGTALGASPGATPQAATSPDDAGRLAARAVAELPFAQRVVLVLKAYQGATLPEIAATIDAPGDVVQALLNAAYRSYVNRISVRAKR